MRGPIAETTLSDRFLACILARNNRVEADLIDQLFDSTEKRLARTLLLVARYGGKDQPEAVDPQVYLGFAVVLRRVVEFRNERDSHLFNC
jgi:CRP/FNR family transcriptional regulator, cyclic AMP receptor protein